MRNKFLKFPYHELTIRCFVKIFLSRYSILVYSSFGFSQDALKGQQHIAQGKRSDTLGQSMFVSDAL